MSHQHTWKDVSYDFFWTYEATRCSRGSSWCSWRESRVYQKENPGARKLDDCTIHYDDHTQYADPRTIIHQKCECGDYRDQIVNGILDIKEDSEYKEIDTDIDLIQSNEDVKEEIDRMLAEDRKLRLKK